MQSPEVPEMTPLPQGRAAQPGQLRWFAIGLLLGQVGLLVVGVAALWRIGEGWWLGAAVGLSFALVYLGLWYFLLAPGSRRRLAFRERLLIHLLVGTFVLVVGGLSDLWVLALVALSITLICDALDENRTLDALPDEAATDDQPAEEA